MERFDPLRFYDWKWQLAHRITTADGLQSVLSLSQREQEEIRQCLQSFKMAITPYYASLIDPKNPKDPIRMQAVPSIAETLACENDLSDPLNEVGDSPVEHLVHRYPDRALLLVTYQCAMYCRHCTRRRAVGERDGMITEKQLEKAIDYLRLHESIRDVLISGGDPLVLRTEKLEHILARLRSVRHVDIIRIGTRVPVVLPMRIDTALTDMLKQYFPIWINTHFNHPNELTPDAQKACGALVDAGIPLGNQSVLLRGINDDTETMKRLLLGLVHMRVRPYYLYQCDLSRGISHFRTSVDAGIRILHDLTGSISGYAVPKYVIDAPGGGGKIPIQYNYVIRKDEQEVVMENYKGDRYRYPQPK